MSYVSRYVEQLISDGLLGGVLDALRRAAVEPELELLRRYRALPPQAHHGRLLTAITGTRYTNIKC